MDNLPNPELLKGSAQDVQAWVILALVALFIATCIYFTRQLADKEKRINKLTDTNIKLAVRSNRAIEALAGLSAPPVEKILDEENDEV